ncbi:MAG: hypothetical protein KA788_13200 [Lacunisphaera sp.]|nr:hypothetical protein [Lacunisphaera sp.]
MGGLFLGLDSSTQSLSACLIDTRSGKLVWEHSLRFGEEFPQYGAPNGFLPNPDPSVVHAPPLMWLDALDRILSRMKDAGLPLGEIDTVAGSGQQHGSVYLNARWPALLAALDPARGLSEQLAPALSRPTAPIWMDSSTGAECAEIETAAGGADALAAKTGSAAYARFTGPQIRAFAKRDPAAYASTAHIALVSSFMASVFAGRPAGIEFGDAAGMNLLDLNTRAWDPGLLGATAPDLGLRLPPACGSDQITGPVHRYFVEKYGFSPTAKAGVWSGDNPCSLAGVGLCAPGDVAISLGTSDTFFGLMPAYRPPPAREGHVFVAPTGDCMALLCFQNGSLARERVRDEFGLDWKGFNDELESVEPGNLGRVFLPWYVPEIIPRVEKAGVHRVGLEPGDAPGHCRGVVEAQMTAMKLHSTWLGVTPRRIFATGGASRNRTILQVMADVNECPVFPSEAGNTAALGAALRAAHAGSGLSWADLSSTFCKVGAPVNPRPSTYDSYRRLADLHSRAERAACTNA